LDTLNVPGAVLYIRVSTAEQADQAHNLPTQKRKVESAANAMAGSIKVLTSPIFI
jgi:DNA invertase Pin-like site-specific DNA recombinase